MTRLVAVDTTGEFGSLALVEDARLLEETPLHSPDGFSHILFDELERLLQRHGWRVEAVDCFAAASGPGSFTGVRVGLAAVKGLAAATEKKVVAVSNLQALAWCSAAPLRAALLDARRGEIYGAVYNARLEAVQAETVRRFPDWLSALPDDPGLEFVAQDFAPFRPALGGTRFERTPVREAPRALAAAVGHIAMARLRAGLASDPADVDANYVRRSDAELHWREEPRINANERT